MKVVDLPSLKTLIRYNDWKHDPLSLNDPANQIAARDDLRTTAPSMGTSAPLRFRCTTSSTPPVSHSVTQSVGRSTNLAELGLQSDDM